MKVIFSHIHENNLRVWSLRVSTDNVCIEALSVNINRHTLDQSIRNLAKLTATINRYRPMIATDNHSEKQTILGNMWRRPDGSAD